MSTELANVAAPHDVRIDDRLNPILVKEVRQALRGRYFRWSFWLTLLVATLIGTTVIAQAAGHVASDEIGQIFFMSMFGCLAAAVHGFVPFSAFLSTSAEWDENTYDLLVISNLRPRQIVLGKLSSALLQALLYYSTFGPFLVMTFLMSGVDLGSVAVILIGSFATCTALSLVGIALSSLATLKIARVVMMALFGAVLVGAFAFSMGMGFAILSNPQVLRDPSGQVAVALYLSATAVVGLVAFAIADARFAHEEENRSTPLRILSAVVVVAASAWGAAMYAQFGEHQMVAACAIVGAVATFPLLLFAMSEPEELGRRVEKSLPKRWFAALALSPFLPGGGRGVLLLLGECALALVAGQLALFLDPTTMDERIEVLLLTATVYAYAFVYIGVPSAVGAFFIRSLAGRTLLRLGILIAIPISIVLPILLGLFLRIPEWADGNHPLNPFVVVARMTYSSTPRFVWVGLTLLAIGVMLGVLLNLPRIVRGLREVLAARVKWSTVHAEPER